MACTLSGTPPRENADETDSSIDMFVSCIRSTTSMNGMRIARPPRTTRNPMVRLGSPGAGHFRPEKMSTSLGEQTYRLRKTVSTAAIAATSRTPRTMAKARPLIASPRGRSPAS